MKGTGMQARSVVGEEKEEREEEKEEGKEGKEEVLCNM